MRQVKSSLIWGQKCSFLAKAFSGIQIQLNLILGVQIEIRDEQFT